MKKFLRAPPLLFVLSFYAAEAQLPEGFTMETVFDDLEYPAGYIPVDTNLSYVYELNGVIKAIIDNKVREEPVLDISEEVGFWSSNGLLGATIDPNFKENGYIYLLYNVDRHHLLYYGAPEYDPNANSTYRGGMGRITRYTINTDDFLSTDYESRLVLLGEEIGTGIPIMSEAHSTGSLDFGDDGSLLAATGDGNTYFCCYNGQGPLPPSAYDSTGLSDGIIDEAQMIGAFRAQFVDALNGKILRIHPETGEGLPNNPFFEPDDPQSNRSKMWATGFRNPFRMRVRRGSGFGDLDQGHPGSIYVCDVGNARWEELNILVDGGGNYGWPLFEGHSQFTQGFFELITYNLNAPNPIYGQNGCDLEYFAFQDLIVQENRQHEYFFPNPCNPSALIPDDIPTFPHERPAMAYRNFWAGGEFTMFPTYEEDGQASETLIEDMEEIEGNSFRGSSIIGGDFLRGESIPEEYRDHYIFADYLGWIRAMKVNDNDEILSIEQWADSVGQPVELTFNPYDGCLYIVSLFPNFVNRICFGGNLRPVPVVEADTLFGSAPMTVEFDASESFDPEGGPITYEWDFGDGSTATGPNATHEFTGEGIVSYVATLSVTDTAGATGSKEILISLNNTPPSVEITSVVEGELYSVEFPTNFRLKANVVDAETSPAGMTYQWKHLLHHNTHFHLLNEFDFRDGNVVIYPTGCREEDVYWYELNLTVTDPGGLTAFDSKMIYPDCDGQLVPDDDSEGYLLFPNPVEDRLTIRSLSELYNVVKVTLLDATGKEIRSDVINIFNGRRYFVLNVEDLQHGVYTLEIDNRGEKRREMFVKL
jgi:glucose/arabinose dehydrogenase